MKKEILTTGKTIIKRIGCHAPSILLFSGIAGFIKTAISAFKAAPKVSATIEKAEIDKKGELTKVEKAKIVVQIMWPTFVLGATSTACLLLSKHISNKRTEALMLALATSERKLKNIQNGLKNIQENPDVKETEHDLCKGYSERTDDSDDLLCYDEPSGRYFYGTKNKIDAAFNRINTFLSKGYNVTMNDLYYALCKEGAPIDITDVGSILGWSGCSGETADHTVVKQVMSSGKADKGRPFLILSYDVRPLC